MGHLEVDRQQHEVGMVGFLSCERFLEPKAIPNAPVLAALGNGLRSRLWWFDSTRGRYASDA